MCIYCVLCYIFQEDLLAIGNYIKPQSNGSVRISVKSNLMRSLAKSTNDLSNLSGYGGFSSPNFTPNSRVMINVNLQDRKQETHNGILKNNNVYSSHKPLVQQKSITFGEL